jgi:hypothetical protein
MKPGWLPPAARDPASQPAHGARPACTEKTATGPDAAVRHVVREPAIGQDDRTGWLAMVAQPGQTLPARPAATESGTPIGPVTHLARSTGRGCRRPCGAPACAGGCIRA